MKKSEKVVVADKVPMGKPITQKMPAGMVDVRTMSDTDLHVAHSKAILHLQVAQQQYKNIMGEMQRRASEKAGTCAKEAPPNG